MLTGKVKGFPLSPFSARYLVFKNPKEDKRTGFLAVIYRHINTTVRLTVE
jgi:hypothetical protein